MLTQETVDRLEGEAFARYLAMRTAFGPCWGAKAPVRPIRAPRPRPARKSWADWLSTPQA